MSEEQEKPDVLTESSLLPDIDPGMVLRSTKTNKLLFVTQVERGKVRGKPITEQGELSDPKNPDKWIEIDEVVVRKLMVEVKGLDVSKLQGYIQNKVAKTLN
jgi:hypothetical protein